MTDFDERVTAAKEASLGQVLVRTARIFDELSIARLRSATGLPVRRAHLALFAFIDFEGTRATEIARRQGVSKQAVAPLLADLVGWSLLERVRDPADGRAWLLRFSRQPGRSLLDGIAVLGGVEADLATVLGGARLDALRAELQAVEAALVALTSD